MTTGWFEVKGLSESGPVVEREQRPQHGWNNLCLQHRRPMGGGGCFYCTFLDGLFGSRRKKQSRYAATSSNMEAWEMDRSLRGDTRGRSGDFKGYIPRINDFMTSYENVEFLADLSL